MRKVRLPGDEYIWHIKTKGCRVLGK